MHIIDSTAIVVNDPNADNRRLLATLPLASIPLGCLPGFQSGVLGLLVEAGVCEYITDHNGYNTWQLTPYGQQLRATAAPAEVAVG